ncbi:amine dehydrogenase large subunit [Novosphingobium decolorationis]|uniref:Methylamine dehydrogenase n=1 Tax=Novosphingobium decolorationis TaxID=2698673 RepID=A0ABX8E8G8_9SPHN|nr:amine dehydrogenase large subunit [Novosphingobium decolorationis]QVM85319.1 methylamine dehydrogenase [Novosphingobium decolorationis]
MHIKTSLRLASALLVLALPGAAMAAQGPLPPPLEEEVSDVAVMGAPGPHRLVLAGGFGSGGAQIRDGEDGKLLGTVSLGGLANIAYAPDQSRIYVAETIWTKGNRGTRQDMISVYDGRTLNLQEEITLPGRVFMVPRRTNFSISTDGARAYMYNFDPSASVNVVDLASGDVQVVDTPGCAHAMAWGRTGFAVICGDGSIGSVDTAKALELKRSAAFFDAENDPLFEEAAIDPKAGKGVFLSYTGVIHEVSLEDAKEVAAWPIQEAAGLELARPDDLQLAWRPGGSVVSAWHHASNLLFVLMHPGEHWTQKEKGTQLWVVDLTKREVVERVPLKTPVTSVEVSQDAEPLLYLVTEDGGLEVLNALDRSEKTSVSNVGSVVPVTPMP